MRKIMNYSKVKVKKGDEVVIISGNHKGKKGAVKFVFPKIGAVVVEGVNIAISDQATLTISDQAVNLWERNMFAVRAEIEIGFIAETDAFQKITRTHV